MFIRSIELNHFRNYGNQKIVFDKGTNILFGSNAQGKTNALEAVFLLSSGRSHRTAREKEMISTGEKYARIYGEIEHRNGIHTVEMILSRSERKRILVNGIAVSKVGEMLGHLCTVIFSPEDLSLIKSAPTARRRFMDLELSQANKVYFYHLQKYLKVLEERNSLLKSIYKNPELQPTLSVWDEQLAKAAVPIISARHIFCDKIKPIAQEIHQNISGRNEQLEIFYETNVDTEKELYEELMKVLEQNQRRDIALGVTTVGPHRDDIGIKLNGLDVKAFGSQGQQRTAALSLKMAEIEFLKKMRGEAPVLLLDDVFSELDTGRQRALVEKLTGVQSIITCTGIDHRLFTGAKRLNIVAGSINRL